MEDIMIANCLKEIGITITDTRNIDKQNRFHHATPHARFTRSQNDIQGYTIGLDSKWLAGDDCCANDTISFHFIKNSLSMRMLHDYLYYK